MLWNTRCFPAQHDVVACAAQVDKLCETKGLDYIDREKAK